jgi:hypothetical protein
VLIIRRNEDAVIDGARLSTDFPSPKTTHADNPGEDLMGIGGAVIPELPDPAIGGKNGSRIRNGYSTGFRSFANRFQPFRGAVAKPPAIRNAVQGNVGVSSRASSLYVGVMDQLTADRGSVLDQNARYVGILPAVPNGN